MSKKKSDKLSEKATLAKFILAIDRGVDINEIYRGKSLIRCYFDTLVHCRDFTREPAKTALKKLKLLVAAGADASEIVYWDYDSLVLELSQKLILLSVLLDSDSARREITGSRLWMLEGLWRQLTEAVEGIACTGLAATDEAPLPLEQLERLRDELDELTGLEALD